jgi:hypothetical protein
MRILAVVLLAALASCAQFLLTEVSKEPITLGPQWQEIRCPEGLEASLPEKRLFLLLQPGADIPDFRDEEVVLAGGRKVKVYAEVVDSDGRAHPLNRWRPRSTFSSRPHPGFFLTLTSYDLPQTLRIVSVRLRSSSPIRVQEVLWASSRTPGGI